MSPPGRIRLLRWGLAVLLLPPLLLLVTVEAAYRYALSRVGELPHPPVPRAESAYVFFGLAEDRESLQPEPLWPWRLVHGLWGGRHSAGQHLASMAARQWLASWHEHEKDRTLVRSSEELALTLWLTRHWTAGEVLTAAAEGAWFGRNAVGLEAAARRYFGKEPGQLALHEAALLAGLPQSPNSLDPFCRPERALRRRQYVLGLLRSLGRISEAREEDAQKQPLLPADPWIREGISCESEKIHP